MKSWLILVAVGALGLGSLRADEAAPAPVIDPVAVKQHYREVLSRPQFQEADETRIDSRVEEWLSQWFRHLGAEFGDFKYASRMPAFESLLMTLLVTFSIAGLIYIMARLTRRRHGIEAEEVGEVLRSKAFRPPEFYDEEIEQAVKAADWHAAWLAAWRQFLSRLEHGQLVEADRTRTNREYLAQMQGKPLPGAAYALLTGMVDAYDRFIYGRISIDEPEWNRFHQQINEAALLLHLDAKSAAAKRIQGTA